MESNLGKIALFHDRTSYGVTAPPTPPSDPTFDPFDNDHIPAQSEKILMIPPEKQFRDVPT